MRTRVWYCPCCKWSYRRLKIDRFPPICNPCDERGRAGFGYKQPHNCRHHRARAVIRAWEVRVGSKVRTQAQRVYRPSAKVRRLWRAIRSAKTRPAIERRAQGWLDAMLAETRDGDYDAGRMTKHPYIDRRTGRIAWMRHVGGPTGTPKVERVDLGGGLMGDFRRSWVHNRYGIRLAHRLKPDELRETLVHEALHVLDSEADLTDKGHGSLWRKRLAHMESLFPWGGV